MLIRRDYAVAQPQRLLGQAQRIVDLDPEADGGPGVGAVVGSSVHAALGVLFGEYEPDEIASRHKEFGLEEGDSTLWVSAADDLPEPGEWLSTPFDQADPQQIVCRFDVSSVFDDEELLDGDEEDDDGADDDVADESSAHGDPEDERV